MFPLSLTIKLDEDTYDELDVIAEFERTKRATFARDELVATVKRYRRNPQYLKFLREKERRAKS